MEGRFYTRARRMPWVLGKLGKDWTLPWVLTSDEIVAVLFAVGTLFLTRGLWAHLGVFGNTVILTGSVVGSVAAMRHLHPEGRSTRAFLRGVVVYAVMRAARTRPQPARFARRKMHSSEVSR